MKLHEASLQSDLLRQAQLEQDLERDIAYSINRSRDKAIKEKEAALLVAKKLEKEKRRQKESFIQITFIH